ncbi:MAG: ClbS/DfsB family four-helix bundle protein [Caldilineaceae bacterium]
MPRPTSKSDLLSAIDKEHGALQAELSKLSPEQMTMPDVVGSWSVKDVVAHLVEWHDMVLSWYRNRPERGDARHPCPRLQVESAAGAQPDDLREASPPAAGRGDG